MEIIKINDVVSVLIGNNLHILRNKLSSMCENPILELRKKFQEGFKIEEQYLYWYYLEDHYLFSIECGFIAEPIQSSQSRFTIEPIRLSFIEKRRIKKIAKKNKFDVKILKDRVIFDLYYHELKTIREEIRRNTPFYAYIIINTNFLNRKKRLDNHVKKTFDLKDGNNTTYSNWLLCRIFQNIRRCYEKSRNAFKKKYI